MEQKNAWNSGTCGTVECEEKENQCGFHEKQGAYCTKKNENEIVKMLKMTKKYWNIVDIRRTAYYDTDMEQVPQYKVPKRKRCKCGTKSGW